MTCIISTFNLSKDKNNFTFADLKVQYQLSTSVLFFIIRNRSKIEINFGIRWCYEEILAQFTSVNLWLSSRFPDIIMQALMLSGDTSCYSKIQKKIINWERRSIAANYSLWCCEIITMPVNYGYNYNYNTNPQTLELLICQNTFNWA